MWELLLKSRKAIFGLVVLIVFILLGTVGPLFVGDPYNMNLNQMGRPPSLAHILGTTSFGQDVFAQLCNAVGNSLLVGLVAGVLGTLIAVFVGAVGPYIGGLADRISNLVTNLALVLPLIPLFIIIASVVRGLNLVLIGIILAVTAWPWAARSIRSQMLTLKEREFVNLARMSGDRAVRIVVTEILPNMMAYIMMVFVILTGTAILTESALSMIGVSTTPTITLGYMLYWAQHETIVPFWWNIWWWFIPPGIVLTVILTAFFVIHAGLDEVFNPKLRRV
ncbi:MAG: ABC transporter permease [Candidatus Thorarchaeota archaeon]|nr:ABC transporter permease [Candidatus Thorarchaeota archaeon]